MFVINIKTPKWKDAANDPNAGILKFIGEELNRHPEALCPTTQECLDVVRKGSSVYIFVRINMTASRK